MREETSRSARNAPSWPICGERLAHYLPIVTKTPGAPRSIHPAIPVTSMKLPTSFLALAAGVALISAASAATVAENWTEHCAKCHGENGKGDTKMGKKLSIADLSDAAVQAKFTDADALQAMKEGLKDKSDKVTMKPIENVSEADMKALVGYVRTLKK